MHLKLLLDFWKKKQRGIEMNKFIRFNFKKETIDGELKQYTADIRNETEARKFHGELLSDSSVKFIEMETIGGDRNE